MSTAPPDLPKDVAKTVSPIPVPTYGAGGVFAVACSTTIAGPALSCLEKVLDLSSYGTWNTFVPAASITTPGDINLLLPSSPPELRDLASRPGYVAPGAKVRFDSVVMVPGSGSSRTVDLEVTSLEAFEAPGGKRGYRVVWKALGIPYFLLHSERVQEFIEEDVADGGGKVETRYACWETFAGVLGYVLPRAQIESGFQRWMDGLKRIVEEEEGKKGGE
ncbi:hypothetical protein F4859DRAFT_477267 [Xylaria cf. heliscus]|nr:hypothetical protein F4859DRAFT_477267 [Xylaria cf. heliscus]